MLTCKDITLLLLSYDTNIFPNKTLKCFILLILNSNACIS